MELDGYNRSWERDNKVPCPSIYIRGYVPWEAVEHRISKVEEVTEYTPRPSFIHHKKLGQVIKASGLTKKEINVIQYIYYDNLTQTEVAKIMSCSQTNICKINARALKKILRALKD